MKTLINIAHIWQPHDESYHSKLDNANDSLSCHKPSLFTCLADNRHPLFVVNFHWRSPFSYFLVTFEFMSSFNHFAQPSGYEVCSTLNSNRTELQLWKSFHGLFNFLKGEYILIMSFWKMWLKIFRIHSLCHCCHYSLLTKRGCHPDYECVLNDKAIDWKAL